MTSQIHLVTAAELLQMPEDGIRRELVRGELREMAPAGNVHGRIAMRLAWRLAQYVEAHQLGVVYAAETGFRLATNPDTVRAADVAFVSQRRVDEVGDVEGYWPGAPDLAVEVISPNDTYTAVEEKVAEWLGAGARSVWVVNPRMRTVAVYRTRTDVSVLTDQDVLSGGDVLAGWEARVADIFA
jgi:Uma2 family endonuclease